MFLALPMITLAGPAAAQVVAPIPTAPLQTAHFPGWWTAFGDPALTAVIERALAGSPTIEVAAARLDQARAAARSTRASLLPSLSASGSAAAQRQSLDDPQIRPFVNAPGFVRDVERYELGLRANWEMDLFGAKPRLRSARARAVAGEADLAAARVAVAAEVATAYFTIVELVRRIAIARERATNLDRQSTALRLRVAQGVTAPLELDRFNGEAGAARAAIPVLEVILAGERARLGVLAGVYDFSEAAALVPMDARLPVFVGDSRAITELGITLANRPDVIAAAARASASEADVSSAQSGRYPRLSLGGLLATIVAGPGALFSSSSIAAQGLGGLSLNLFDFGRIDAEIASAKGTRREALANYRQTLLTASAELAVAAQTITLRRAEGAQRAASQAALERATRAATATYAAGALDLTTLLDTDRARLASSEAALAAQAEAARAVVALVRASAGTDVSEVLRTSVTSR